MAKVSIKALGLSVGVVWSAGILLLGLLSTMFGWGSEIVKILSSIYMGYDSTIVGSILGGIWAFVDGCIGGVAIAWVYNKFVK